MKRESEYLGTPKLLVIRKFRTNLFSSDRVILYSLRKPRTIHKARPTECNLLWQIELIITFMSLLATL